MLNPTQLAQQLRRPGSIAVIPTDTVYGVVARAADQAAVARLYRLKRREGKPGTIIAAGVPQLAALGLSPAQLKAAERFWPGAVSVIIPCPAAELAYLHQGVGSLAVRLPADHQLQALLEQTGPLLTSSANQPGQPPATTLAQAHAAFGPAVDMYQDGGDLSHRRSSTLIRITDQGVEVLRQGAVLI